MGEDIDIFFCEFCKRYIKGVNEKDHLKNRHGVKEE